MRSNRSTPSNGMKVKLIKYKSVNLNFVFINRTLKELAFDYIIIINKIIILEFRLLRRITDLHLVEFPDF